MVEKVMMERKLENGQEIPGNWLPQCHLPQASPTRSRVGEVRATKKISFERLPFFPQRNSYFPFGGVTEISSVKILVQKTQRQLPATPREYLGPHEGTDGNGNQVTVF